MCIAGAVSWARANHQPGRTLNIVTILSDTGRNYVSKLYDSDWLTARNLPLPE